METPEPSAGGAPSAAPGADPAPSAPGPAPGGVARLALILAVAASLALFAARALDVSARTSATFDEPVNIAAGLELLQYGTTEMDPINPPLARALVAAPLFLRGERLAAPPRKEAAFPDGIAFLEGRPSYRTTLALARLPATLVALALLCGLLASARARLGPLAGAAALVAAAHLPSWIGHAAVAGTDLVAAAAQLCALAAFARLLERGGAGAAALFALAAAAALLSKLSSVPFLLVCLPLEAALLRGPEAVAALRGPRAWLRAHGKETLVVALLLPLAVWAGYGFALAPAASPEEAARIAGGSPLLEGALRTALPLGGFARGVLLAAHDGRLGRPSFLAGEVSMHGWAHYYLVTTALKVPLGLLAGAGIGLALSLRRRASAAGRAGVLAGALALAILLAAGLGGIAIGHRYVLAVEPLLALLLGCGVAVALEEPRPALRRGALALLGAALAAHVAASWAAHPDMLGYTNALAGPRPERWLADSSIDWGQDLDRLGRWARARGVEEVRLAYFGTASPLRSGVPARPLAPFERATGWIAVSVTRLDGVYEAPGRERGYAWLEALPEAGRIGTSIVLWRVSEEDLRRLPPPEGR